jgi:hypothetical protein
VSGGVRRSLGCACRAGSKSLGKRHQHCIMPCDAINSQNKSNNVALFTFPTIQTLIAIMLPWAVVSLSPLFSFLK